MNIFSIYTVLTLLLAAGKWVSGQNASTPGVADVVTDAFFDGIANQAGAGCAGRGFYTRTAFLEAIQTYPQFGTVGGADNAKREIAAFFAHATRDTRSFCDRESVAGSNYCDPNNREWPCVPGKSYQGRGPLALLWNYNYGPAGRDIGFDGLSDPDIVARDAVISFKTALWFWMRAAHGPIASGLGFGFSINAIRNWLCAGGNTDAVAELVGYYTKYCIQLGVELGPNLVC